jgi:hypothetical protein
MINSSGTQSASMAIHSGWGMELNEVVTIREGQALENFSITS